MYSRRSGLSLRQPALIITGLFALLAPGTAADNKGTVAGLPAASTGLQAPVLGFIAQDATRLRPVVGVVGAAVLGDSFALQDSVTGLSISPSGSFAVAERSDGQPLSVLPIGPDAVGVLQPVAGAFLHGDRVDFSVSGSTAALYSASRQRIQIIGNLPDTAAIRQEAGCELPGFTCHRDGG